LGKSFLGIHKWKIVCSVYFTQIGVVTCFSTECTSYNGNRSVLLTRTCELFILSKYTAKNTVIMYGGLPLTPIKEPNRFTQGIRNRVILISS
jgi:hypothetical protein